MLPADIGAIDRILTWRATTRRDGEAQATGILAMPAAERSAFMEREPAARAIGTLEALLFIAHEELDRDPSVSLQLTTLVLRHLEAVEVPPGAEAFRTLFEASAWKEHAHALRATGSPRQALDAVLRAVAAVGVDPLYSLQRADAELLEAYIRHELDDTTAALPLLARCVAVFNRHNDGRRYLRARSMEAALQYELRQYKAAEAGFLAMKDEAERMGDRAELARLYNNLGHCSLKLEKYDAASRWLVRALTLLEELNMDGERQRAMWGLASLLARQGRSGEAAESLARVRADFMSRGMVLDAAMVSLDLVELLVTAGDARQVSALCSELVSTFTAAGMTNNALTALAFLRDVAETAPLAPDTVRQVHRFVRGLKSQPSMMFAS
jgi:tetratricopeptide (TPR) repeat protein